jgi:hypothetical protein
MNDTRMQSAKMLIDRIQQLRPGQEEVLMHDGKMYVIRPAEVSDVEKAMCWD